MHAPDDLGLGRSGRRHQKEATLQRPGRAASFRPWLDPGVALTPSIVTEVRRRALAEGAWQEADARADDGGDLEEDDLELDEADDLDENEP